MRSRLFFVDHDDTGAPAGGGDPFALPLRGALLAAVPMLTVAPTFAIFLAGEGVASTPLVAGIAAVAVGQLAVVLIARWGRRRGGDQARAALLAVTAVIAATLVTPWILRADRRAIAEAREVIGAGLSARGDFGKKTSPA